jgi:hypothetical protein
MLVAMVDQRDITSEGAAAHLRRVSAMHYASADR